ncbi:MAG: VWA domain-containing protein [candidate division WOR-3 bacterium]|nr:VWA domain-containing protein [candidate division WOR-3 bacterium]
MRFANPLYFLLFIPVAGLIYWELRKRTGTLKFSDAQFFKNFKSGIIYRYITIAMNTSILFFIVLALARPQKGRLYEETETQGVDIMLCLDISGSMQAEDFSPKNRLHVAKERAKEFISKRTGDRIGLVIFAVTALTQCPLTTDHKILLDLLDRIDFGIIQDGTAIGMGLATAVARLKDSSAKEKIVILLTDGLNNAGEIDPITAAKLAQAHNIKVYCICVGSKGPVPIPFNHPIYGKIYVREEIDFDMKTLEEISNLTGGKAFLATDGGALKTIYEEIDRLEPTTFKVSKYTVYSERAQDFMLPAVIMSFVSFFLSATFLRRIP